jgi:hypothetical protein
MTEYALIMAAVAVVVFVVYQTMGPGHWLIGEQDQHRPDHRKLNFSPRALGERLPSGIRKGARGVPSPLLVPTLSPSSPIPEDRCGQLEPSAT